VGSSCTRVLAPQLMSWTQSIQCNVQSSKFSILTFAKQVHLSS